MAVLQVSNLVKKYGRITALNDVSFEVPQGAIFGILGPNGSGKTTLLGVVMDVLKATSGTFLWNGQPGSNEQRKLIGTLLETPNFYHYLSAVKNLEIVAEIKGRGHDDIERVLQTVNLLQRKDSKFSTYSLGMKQRLAIASALLGNPDILVFDEPTNGLDPAGIAEIRELLKGLSAQGKTVIMASHILDEVEKVCTHVAIIQKGNLKTVGTVQEVLNATTEVNNSIDISAEGDNTLLLQVIQQMPNILSATAKNSVISISLPSNMDGTDVNQYCVKQGITLNHIVQHKQNLEGRFLEITGGKSDR